MISPETIVAIATVVSAGAAFEVVRSLAKKVYRRVTGDRANAEKRTEIIQLAANQGDVDATIGAITETLNDVGEAVVVLDTKVVIKDSAAGTPRIVVRDITPAQRLMIDSNKAPLNNATLFHAWLDDTRQPEASN